MLTACALRRQTFERIHTFRKPSPLTARTNSSITKPMSALSIKTLGTRVSKWGEGPIWWQDRLLYVDIEGHALVQLDPSSGEEHSWELGERIGTVVPTDSGDFLYAGDSGIVLLNRQTGARCTIADPEAALRTRNRFNDGKCDPAGRFWAGTISLVKDTGTANLYCLDTDGSLTLKSP